MLAKPTADASEGGALDDEPVVCCTVFLLVDVVLKLQVCALTGGCLNWMPESDAGTVLKKGTAKPGGVDATTGGTAGEGCFEVGGL